jgi:preprotein translocase subunit SecE
MMRFLQENAVMSADKTLGEQPSRRRRPVAGKSREELREAAEAGERAVSAKAKAAAPARREREDDEEEKPRGIAGFFAGLRDYFEGVQSELRKVVWPSAEDRNRLTVIVITTLIIASIVLGLIVLGFTELFRLGLQRPEVLFGFLGIVLVAAFAYWRISSRRASA